MNRLAFIITLLLGALPAYALAATNDQMACYDLYKPVCAAQQVQCVRAPCYPVYRTYGNDCEAGRANAPIIHQGACADTETGPVKPAVPYTPPASCIAWNDGCNSCGRTPSGDAVCTQRACLGPTPPGYCTQYETSAPQQTDSGTSSPATSAATTTEPGDGFFARLWHALLSLFR
jgi:hypothetical protein